MSLPLPFLSTSAALLASLLMLETVLSADNAIALASLVKPVEAEEEREWLLNRGLATAIVFRCLAVAAAGVVLHHPVVRMVGGGYLVWLAARHFRRELGAGDSEGASPSARPFAPGPETAASETAASETGAKRPSRLAMVALLAGTNLAFSLDSIAAALAMTDNIALVMGAGAAGVVALRWLTGWVLRWMERLPNLGNAGYFMVLAVGLRLIGEQIAPSLSPSEPVMAGWFAVMLAWGLHAPQPAKATGGPGDRKASRCGSPNQPSFMASTIANE